MPRNQETVADRNHLNLSLDFRLITLLLLAVIAAMIFIWKPWDSTNGSSRTIEVTGEATLTAEPDEFVFHPTYQVKSSDRSAALADITKKSDAVVSGLKELGVEDRHIKTSSSGYDFPEFRQTDDDRATYTLQLTVTVDKRELAQKVQDYLVGTTPTGSISPQAGFSDEKRRELENEARDEATREARSKAEQSAENLGFRIGKVKSVEDGAGFDGVMPFSARGALETDSSSSDKLTVQPGENEFTYTVSVTYFLR